LQLSSSDFIYSEYPNFAEGVLTPLRANLVNSLMLSKIALSLSLNKYLFISKGEKMSVEQFLSQLNDKTIDESKLKCYVLADAVEALFGAIYLDQGFLVARNVIIDILKSFVGDVIEKNNQKDHKSLLQEKMQEIYKKAPTYKVIKSAGPAHQVFYTVSVSINNLVLGTGEG
jgi:ribonuclease-3